jgi:hypothetical protein
MSESGDADPTREQAEDDRDTALREEQEGKGYGNRYGADEGEAEPGLTEEE